LTWVYKVKSLVLFSGSLEGFLNKRKGREGV